MVFIAIITVVVIVTIMVIVLLSHQFEKNRVKIKPGLSVNREEYFYPIIEYFSHSR